MNKEIIYHVGYRDFIRNYSKEKIFVVASKHYNLRQATQAFNELTKTHSDVDVELQCVTTTIETLLCLKANHHMMDQVKYCAECTKTTVIVEDVPFYVYQYDDGTTIDTIIRTSSGMIIDDRHPNYVAIGKAFTDSTPE